MYWLILAAGIVTFGMGLLLLRNWRRVNAAMLRFSARVGWPTDDESTAPRFVFAGITLVGAGWIFAAVLHLT